MQAPKINTDIVLYATHIAFLEKMRYNIITEVNGVQENFFEQIHSASADLPYFDGEMRNINYLSHFHTEIELILVRTGSVDITCEGKAFRADEGSICIFMPGEIHSFSSPCDNHLYIIKLYCRNSAERTDFSSLRTPSNIIESDTCENSKLTEMINTLAYEMTGRKVGFAYAANAVASNIISYILRALPLVSIDPNERRRHMSEVALLELVSGFIGEHYSEEVELDAAAKYCNLSKYYFAHLFKKRTNKGVTEYINETRIHRAKELLEREDLSIGAIACRVGFNDINYFSRKFKAITGITPTQYKRTYESAPMHRLGSI